MSATREGIRRLKHSGGSRCSGVLESYVFIASEGFSGMDDPFDWIAFFGGMPVAFVLGWGLVRGVAWVVEDFGYGPVTRKRGKLEH